MTDLPDRQPPAEAATPTDTTEESTMPDQLDPRHDPETPAPTRQPFPWAALRNTGLGDDDLRLLGATEQEIAALPPKPARHIPPAQQPAQRNQPPLTSIWEYAARAFDPSADSPSKWEYAARAFDPDWPAGPAAGDADA